LIATPEAIAEDMLSKGQARRRIAAVLALFVLACAIRFFRLGHWSFWADEIATLRDAENLRAVIGYPVGYALIGAWMRLWGVTEFTARFVPAVFGAVTVPVIYLVGRSMFSHRVGILAGAFLALSNFHLFFSQFARYYTLLMLLSLLAMWAIYTGVERNARGRLITGLALLALGFWTHWAAALLVPATALCFLWLWCGGERPLGLTRANMLLFFLPLCGGILLVPPVVRFLGSWTGGAGFSLFRAGLTALKLLYRLDAGVLVCAAAGGWLLLRLHDRRAKWLISFVLVPSLLMVVLVGFSQGGSRFGIVVLPPVVLLAAGGLDRLLHGVVRSSRIWVSVVLVLVLLLMGLKDAAYFTVEKGQRPRWREAVAYYREMALKGPHTLIASTPAIAAHYGGEEARALREIDDSELRALFVHSPEERPAWILVEHVANVAPTETQQVILSEHATLVRRWPLQVGLLDYSMSLYSNLPSRASISLSRKWGI